MAVESRGGWSSGNISFRQTFRALRHRNYRLFFVGQLISLIGTWMENTAMGWLVYQLSGSKFLLGTGRCREHRADAAAFLVGRFGRGSLSEKVDPRRYPDRFHARGVPPRCHRVGRARQPWHIVVLAAVNGVAMAFDMPARQSFVIEMTSREDLMNAISLNSSVFNGARLIGPLIAGFVLERFSAAACFFFNGSAFLR